MDIFEKAEIYTNPLINRNDSLEDIVSTGEKYLYDVNNALDKCFYSLWNNKSEKYAVYDTKVAISPHHLFYENEEVYEKLFPKEDLNRDILEEEHRKDITSYNSDIFCDKITIHIRKEIEDNLSLEDINKEKENLHKLVKERATDFRQTINRNANSVALNKAVESEEIPIRVVKDLCTNPQLIENLADKENRKQVIDYIKIKEFEGATSRLSMDLYDVGKKYDIDNLDFMKEVVKAHGTNGEILNSAVNALTEARNETPAFAHKLLNDTLKTEEYKQAFEGNKGITKETVR